jgi:PTH1 family peptidyl-tRNA hydrolase
MRLIVGLGNPGGRYRDTRHNVGFVVIDRLAARWRITLGGQRHGTETGAGEIAGVRAMLAKPQTFMNLSGEAVGRLRAAHRLSPAAILIVHDDLDLTLGRVRVRTGGGAGGHNGVLSLIGVLGRDFARVRIGIGRPAEGRDPADFVLEPFAPGERAVLGETIERAADAVESWLKDGIERTMTAFNRRPVPG